jgi:hypothetical protein
MRGSLIKLAAVGLAALTLSLGVFASTTPAEAGHWRYGWHGGWHGGGYGGWRAGWRGPGWYGCCGRVVTVGVVAPVAVYPDGGCWRSRPVYNGAGVYIGRRAVNVCY